jgi:hypothetical protein
VAARVRHRAPRADPPVVRARRLAPGLLLAAVYVAAVAVTARTGLRPVRPLFDGQAPVPPYQWVDPPPEFADGNVPPEPVEVSIELSDGGTRATSFGTPDAQAIVTLPDGAVPPAAGAEAALVTVEPVDPEAVGPPPSDLRFDGNAYRVEIAYQPSGDPAELREPLTLVLRYPAHATVLLGRDASRWTPLVTNQIRSTLQLWAGTRRTGVFVAAAPRDAPIPDPGGGFPWLWATLGASAAAAVLALVLTRKGPSGPPRPAPPRRRPR